MSPSADKRPAQSSHRSASVDIELQKQSDWPAETPGDQDADEAPLLGDSGGDAGAGDTVAMPVAAWLLLLAAVSRCRVARQPPEAICIWTCEQSALTPCVLLDPQLCAKSSAGAVFEALHDVGPFTAAAWRMQVATLGMLPCAALQYWRCGAGTPVMAVWAS